MFGMKWGFVSLPTIIAAALGIGFAASAYLNYSQYQAASQNQKLLQGQIVDLKYQVTQDHLADSSPSPSPTAKAVATTASPSPSPSSSAAPAVAGTATVSISQFGVSLSASDPITDLTYAPVESGGLIVAGFTTQSLLAKYPNCKALTALGMLIRRPASQIAPYSDGKPIKTIGGYKFYYKASTAYCANDYAGENELAADRAAIANTTMPTLTAN
jgi:hypothetical protein